ncbi:MAG: hypothetical protein GTO45_33535 [Candidatus Aminicenantes bacterium]|nr:hypothetical protein [Candidatus Aminicenantes bacterium]NIM79309.1 hypothetical protein [Candidatus Aminicenantes bacterium]NIN23056.1 hypothetical protein [Candidatus Aminicenantes bacterium]NIN46783.1 hypothetical protein [Candidatus Aminicenantes bacterium]NIN89705.1 hypothetical protein [Candidatus Aminicenantes bacterium]
MRVLRLFSILLLIIWMMSQNKRNNLPGTILAPFFKTGCTAHPPPGPTAVLLLFRWTIDGSTIRVWVDFIEKDQHGHKTGRNVRVIIRPKY